MKALATVNFKGGVGKTTVTWLLAQYVAKERGKRVLVIDADAQMSLTLAVTIQEDTGLMMQSFGQWYDNTHIARDKTIFNAIDEYDKYARGAVQYFNFPIDQSFIFTGLGDNLHFIPSVVDLYWLELEVMDRAALRAFAQTLLGKITASRFQYDYVFFDCPPSFSPLSYSVLSCCSMLVIPVNPDVFASRGVRLMLEGIKNRLQPFPLPKSAVFMNKAKVRSGVLTRESSGFLTDCDRTAGQLTRDLGLSIKVLDAFIPERVDIKRAIPRGFLDFQFQTYFASLWNQIEALV